MNSICPSNIDSLSSDVLLLDIRERFEFNTYRAQFENYRNIPFSSFETEITTLDKNQKTVLICNNALRSKTAVQYLIERGFTDVLFVNGGFIKWKQNHLKIIGNPPDFISHSLSLSKDCVS